MHRLKELENKAKFEDITIDQLQKEIKYVSSIREQQGRELKVFENEELKQAVQEQEREVGRLKEKIKSIKKASQAREESEKWQQIYQINLERALRKRNDDYSTAKADENRMNDDQEITEAEWDTVKSKLFQLRKAHQLYSKKIDQIYRQRNRQLKAAEQNELKVKEKMRKLQTLKSKLAEMHKLVTVRTSHKKEDLESHQPLPTKQEIERSKPSPHEEEEQLRGQPSRQFKKWVIPEGHYLQYGKTTPDSIFFSDKPLLKDSKKSKIREVSIWHNQQNIPCLFQFVYQDDKQEQIQGNQPIPNLTHCLELAVFTLKEGDYLHLLRGYFHKGNLAGIHLVSKFGKQLAIESSNAQSQGEIFVFEPRPNQIPSCMFGAYVCKGESEARVCQLGVEFITDW